MTISAASHKATPLAFIGVPGVSSASRPTVIVGGEQAKLVLNEQVVCIDLASRSEACTAGRGGYVYAVDVDTGEIRSRTKVPGGASDFVRATHIGDHVLASGWNAGRAAPMSRSSRIHRDPASCSSSRPERCA